MADTTELILPKKEGFYLVRAKTDEGKWTVLYCGEDKDEYRAAIDKNIGKYVRINGYINPSPAESKSKTVILTASDSEVKASKERQEALERANTPSPTPEQVQAKKDREHAVSKVLDVVEGKKPNTRIGTLEAKNDKSAATVVPGGNKPLPHASQPLVK